MQAQTTNPAPVRAPCPPMPQASFLGWLASILGLSAPAYRGAGQPASSGGIVFSQAPRYRPPRPRTQPSGSCASAAVQQPPEASGENGAPYLNQPVLLEGPVTIVIGPRE